MKNLKVTLGAFIIAASLITSCEKKSNDTNEILIPATSQEFAALKMEALENQKQNFQFDAATMGSFTTENGVEISINGLCLTKNGNPVTGNVDVVVVELFERGNMLTTNKSTMGRMPNGDKALLLSGGEFFIEATQNGEALEISCGIQAIIPTNLTGGDDNLMTIWEGVADCNDANGDGIDDDCDGIVWEQDEVAAERKVEIGDGQNGGNVYYSFFSDFGWTNVDRFYMDPRPKTTILVDVPEGYDNENSAVYLSYDGEANALANLDTYNATTELFSEHYGQIPVGLECHVIFASEIDGEWLYAIKAATITANGIIVFTEAELATATEAQLITLINALP